MVMEDKEAGKGKGALEVIKGRYGGENDKKKRGRRLKGMGEKREDLPILKEQEEVMKEDECI